MTKDNPEVVAWLVETEGGSHVGIFTTPRDEVCAKYYNQIVTPLVKHPAAKFTINIPAPINSTTMYLGHDIIRWLEDSGLKIQYRGINKDYNGYGGMDCYDFNGGKYFKIDPNMDWRVSSHSLSTPIDVTAYKPTISYVTEIRTKLKVVAYLEEMLCYSCGKGKMEATTGTMLLTHPVKFPHKCTVCGHKANYTKSYPVKNIDAVPYGDSE